MTSRHIILALVFIVIIGAIIYLQGGTVRPTDMPTTDQDIVLEQPSVSDAASSTASEQSTPTAQPEQPTQTQTKSTVTYLTPAQKALTYERAKEISTPDGFVNVPNITIKGELEKGNIVLVDFWTYSCINCQRTLPYLNAWQQAYGDKGLTIIGVHTPEFDFEKDIDNVKTAVEKFGITFPVVLDNDYSTWQSYNNHYWPHKYLIDIDGFIVYDHIGEGGYEETEKQIQKLLAERAARLGTTVNMDALTSTTVTADAPTQIQTPETYFGSLRNEYVGNITRGTNGTQTATVPDALQKNTTYLGGSWDIHDEYAESNGATTITLPYHATIVNFVAASKTPMTISISQDGKKVTDVLVHDATLYELIRNTTSGDHTITITIPKNGLQAFTFTFG